MDFDKAIVSLDFWNMYLDVRSSKSKFSKRMSQHVLLYRHLMFILTFKGGKKIWLQCLDSWTESEIQSFRHPSVAWCTRQNESVLLEYGESYDGLCCTLQHFSRKKTGLSDALLSVFNKVLGTICDFHLGKEGKNSTEKQSLLPVRPMNQG